jgi:hypothetical protein
MEHPVVEQKVAWQSPAIENSHVFLFGPGQAGMLLEEGCASLVKGGLQGGHEHVLALLGRPVRLLELFIMSPLLSLKFQLRGSDVLRRLAAILRQIWGLSLHHHFAHEETHE